VRFVFDPGVVVSAALTEHGVPAKLLRLWDEGMFELVVSPLLLAELRGVLGRPHIADRVPSDRARALVSALAAGSIELPDPPNPPAVTRDPKDDYLVALTREAGAFALVSGDMHLFELDIRPPVLTPRELFELLQPS
jgi:putative PIN family toxin of toxin-antitoxin system